MWTKSIIVEQMALISSARVDLSFKIFVWKMSSCSLFQNIWAASQYALFKQLYFWKVTVFPYLLFNFKNSSSAIG